MTPPKPAADPALRRVAAANTDFGFRLLKEMRRNTPHKNVFFSPFSVSQALTLTLNGAGGATQTDMAKTLGLGALPLDEVNHANGSLLPSLTNPDPKVQLSVANALWADTGTALDAGFQQRGREFYHAHAETLNLDTPAAVDTINGWVKTHTNGRIDKIISQPNISSSPAVLTNAVYFHGPWSRKFNPAHTQTALFTLVSGETKPVPLMTQQGQYPYLETLEFQAICLPYGEGRMSLLIFLPRPTNSLADFVAGWMRAPGQAG